jgi:hypothetical protein
MAITVLFDVPNCSTSQYDNVVKDLKAAGQDKPQGRKYHVASPSGNDLFVLDVWESQETFQKFAQTLMPILAKNGLNPKPPKVLPTHNIITA